MSEFKTHLPAKLYEFISKCDIATPKQILTLSKWDIKKITNLSNDDISLLKNAAADYIFTSGPLRGDQLLQTDKPKVSTGCSQFDKFLRGGFRCGTITEIYGESGSGKTQICVNASLNNWKSGVVYICTEDAFPMTRFVQMANALPDYDPTVNYGERIFIDYIKEQAELISCVKVRLRKLMAKCRPTLIVIDSIAAPFRSESTDYVNRAQYLREIAFTLIEIAKDFNAAVICINQVTSPGDDIIDETIPSLGLAWSNMVSTRFQVKKTYEAVQNDSNSFVRDLNIIFSPELPNNTFKFIITSTGIKVHC